jgi:hypothetical protein
VELSSSGFFSFDAGADGCFTWNTPFESTLGLLRGGNQNLEEFCMLTLFHVERLGPPLDLMDSIQTVGSDRTRSRLSPIPGFWESLGFK